MYKHWQKALLYRCDGQQQNPGVWVSLKEKLSKTKAQKKKHLIAKKTEELQYRRRSKRRQTTEQKKKILN